jgi:spermidine/putrescine transport system permease protein
VALTLPLAYALAATIAFALPRRRQATALALIVLPFWTSYVVRTYAWLLALSDTGVINRALLAIGLIDEPLVLVNARSGVLIVFVHYFLMVMTLSIFVNLRRIPTNYIRAARDLGAPWHRVFLHVVLPLSVPGVAVGVFLTIVIAIGDYVTPQIVGGGNELTLPQAVMLQVGRFADTPMAAAISFILMLLIVAVLLAFGRHLRSGGAR